MPNLNGLRYNHRGAAVWTAFARLHVTHVCVLFYREIAAGSYVTQVVVLFVRARNQVSAAFQCFIDVDHLHAFHTAGVEAIHIEADGSEKAARSFEDGLNLFPIHRPDFSRASYREQLGFVEHVIAADENRDGPLETLAFLGDPSTDHCQRLDLLLR